MGLLVNVKVNPKARFNRVEENSAGDFTVWTTAAPDKGQANDAVTKALADHLGISKSAVSLKRGATSRKKLFEIVR